ncbi:MAG: hypothetical protein BWY54_00992 [Candidatus Dependentiae bacterium ADurb.Bin331]|nr:MAG: hypothetical protein BWY54_00992 [Candidatus Dependentiae bacterium ADurb.Bin331]
MKKIFVLVFLFSSHSALSSINNRYGGKDARRIALIQQKTNPKQTALQKVRFAEVALKKNAHQLQMKNNLVTYSSLSWKSNLSDVD